MEQSAPAVLRNLRRTIFLISLPFGILYFALPIYGQEIGADAIQIGLFFSAFSLMTVLIRPLVGNALDRYGRRPFALVGVMGYALTMFAFAFSTEVWIITLARALQGIASAFLWLAARSMTADLAPEDDRGRSFGSVDQAGFQGSIVGTFIGFPILLGAIPLNLGGTQVKDQGNWLLLFLIYGGIGLAALLYAAFRLPETNPVRPPTHQPRPIQWSRPWLLLLLVTLITGASWAMVSPIMMVYLQEKLNADVSALALAYLPAALIWAALPSRLGSLADRLGRKPLMVLGLVAAAVSSIFLPHVVNLIGLAALWGFQALCYAAGDPAEQALVADLTGGDQRGRGFGLYTMAAGLGATIGPLAGGWLYERVSFQSPFYLNGIVLVLCAGILALWLQVPRRPGEA